MEDEVFCYNRGCGQSFKLNENGPNSCTFHPGVPYFHDAYKIWTCCNRKCVDFTEFLGMVGCATGFHSNVKPVVEEPKKPMVDETAIEDTGKNNHPAAQQIERPDPNAPMTDIKQDIAPSLKNNKSLPQVAKEPESFAKTCMNQGCSMEFIKRDENPVCTHHPGEAVFHEGLKFWSCCKKKSMEFDDFLKQKGCVQGEHLWVAKKKIDCRFDWHQTATHVILTMYTKGYDYNQVKIMANGIKLMTNVDFPDGKVEKEWILYGVVNETESSALLQSTKIEIKLRKAHPLQWTNLTLNP